MTPPLLMSRVVDCLRRAAQQPADWSSSARSSILYTG